MYCAIIGDIIGSKALADRAGVQAKLQETLTQVNGRYEKALASDCTITLGDEFQALLVTPVPAFEPVSYTHLTRSSALRRRSAVR